MLATLFFRLSRRWPKFMKALIRKGVERRLPAGYDVDTHFSRATTRGTSGSASCRTATSSRRSAKGSASVVTDRIETFTENGLKLESGEELRRTSSSRPPA